MTKELEKEYDKGLNKGIRYGIQCGILIEAQRLINLLLNRKFGHIDPNLKKQIDRLDTICLEDLGEALLKFSSIDEVEDWLTDLLK